MLLRMVRLRSSSVREAPKTRSKLEVLASEIFRCGNVELLTAIGQVHYEEKPLAPIPGSR